MSNHPAAYKFKKKRVVMKNDIPVFEGYAATGGISGVQFSIVCPDRESCDEIWNILGTHPLDHDGVQKVVLCLASDIEMDVTATSLRGGEQVSNEFNLERAKAGELVEHLGPTGWELCKFLGLSESGDECLAIELVNRSGFQLSYASPASLRMAPKKVKVRYRVAVMKHGHGGFYTITANDDYEAESVKGWTNFIRWLTDWIETEVTE